MPTKLASREKRVARVGQHRQVVIPRDILENLNLQKGDWIAFTQQADGVLLRPKRLVEPDDVLTPAQGKQVRRGMDQIKAGRFRLWRDVKHAMDR